MSSKSASQDFTFGAAGSVPQNQAKDDEIFAGIVSFPPDDTDNSTVPAGSGSVNFGTIYKCGPNDTNGIFESERGTSITEDFSIAPHATELDAEEACDVDVQTESTTIVDGSQCSPNKQDQILEAGPQSDFSSISYETHTPSSQVHEVYKDISQTSSSTAVGKSQSTPSYLPLDGQGNVLIDPFGRIKRPLDPTEALARPPAETRPEFCQNKLEDPYQRKFDNVLHYLEVNQDVVVKALDRCPEVLGNHLNAKHDAVKSFLDTNPEFLEQYLTKNSEILKKALNSRMIASFLSANPDSLTKALSQDYMDAALSANSKKFAKALGQNQAFLNNYLTDNPVQLIKALKANPGIRNCAHQGNTAYTVAMVLHIPESELENVDACVSMAVPKDSAQRKQVLDSRSRFEEASELMGEPVQVAETNGHLEIPDDNQIASQKVENDDQDDSDSDDESEHSDDDEDNATGRGLGKGLPPDFILNGRPPPEVLDDETDCSTTAPTGRNPQSEPKEHQTARKSVKLSQGTTTYTVNSDDDDDGQPEASNRNLNTAKCAKKRPVVFGPISESESDADVDPNSDEYAESDSDPDSDGDDGLEEGEIVDSIETADAKPVLFPPTRNLPYPAPRHLVKASKLQQIRGNQWTLWEEERTIYHMLAIRNEGIIQGEERFREVARRLAKDKIDRGWLGVKNFWNRIGRMRSGFDERKNKNAPLATSAQGKQAKARNKMAKAKKPKTDKKGKNPACKKEKPSKRKRSDEASDDDDWSAPAKKKGKTTARELTDAECRSAQLGLRNTGAVNY